MSVILSPYLQQIHEELVKTVSSMERSIPVSKDSTMQSFPMRPLVEGYSSTDPWAVIDKEANELLVQKKVFERSAKKERCLVESSSNSVRCSFVFKQHNKTTATDPLEKAVWDKYIRFFQRHAEKYAILRRKPVPGFSISFLILNEHVEQFGQDTIIAVILGFLQKIDKECSDVKISLNARGRFIASDFIKSF